MIFPPNDLIGRLPALRNPPVNSDHAAFEPCNKFLDYLGNMWFNGPFKDMWCKWNVEEIRITKAAEAYHKKLRGMLSRRTNPPFDELLECLHALNTEALGKLLFLKNVNFSKPLRRRDRTRRQKKLSRRWQTSRLSMKEALKYQPKR
ncbi:hypothetical protein ANCCAN_05826 [Ancylostoma caninum]|uniref:Uncharacterized protein n=1 Tax=Ancylostoma caninum TaxID=29170 RepID=A0A368GUV9_ANCCA|nr:hypothetical protein ANCCAN_05826 [Ancylostoma caninum]